VVDAVLVTTGMLFFLAAQYGTFEFFGQACLMAALPLIPGLVLVGGAGSTVFVLTKVMVEKRALSASKAVALLVGPGLLLFLTCIVLALGKSPERRLSYICHGHAPASAGHVRVIGYSTFLGEEWLSVFTVNEKDFQAMVAKVELTPADAFELEKMFEQSSLKTTGLFKSCPSPGGLQCFKREFNAASEHERGRIYAVYDAATLTAIVYREYRD